MFKINLIYPDLQEVTYKEIDDFQDYEFNNCIAYEFAIRNTKIISELERFEQEFINLEKKKPDFSKDELIMRIDYYDFYILYNAGFDIDAMLYWLFMKRAKKLHFFSNLKNDELSKYYIEINTDQNHEYHNKIQSLQKLFNPIYISGNIAEGLSASCVKIKKSKFHKVTKDKKGRLIYYDTIDPQWNPTGWSNEIKIQDIEGSLLPSIIMTFKRPILKIIDRHEHFSVPLNMGMSKKDLLAYISLLKDEYNKRANIDTDNNQKFLDSKSKYLNKIVKFISKKIISPSTILGLNHLYQHKNRVFTISDLFRDTYYRDSKPHKLGKLSAKKAKELLYIYDYVSSAKKFNENLKATKENALKLAETSMEKEEINTYYRNEVINITELQDGLYRKLVKKTKKLSQNHKINQYYALAIQLIDKQKYKYLI